MLLPLFHTFEGGTDGATFTAGSGGNTNVGGNNYFDTVSIGAGCVAQFDRAAAYRGGLGARFASRGTSAASLVRWNTSLSLLPSTSDYFIRFYFRAGSAPAINSTICQALGTGAAQQFAIAWTTTSLLGIRNAADSLFTTTAALALGKWYRVEVEFFGDTATGYATLRYYSNPEAAVGDFTGELNANGATTWAMATAASGHLSFGGPLGATTNWPSSSAFVDFDEIGVGTDWVGGVDAAISYIPSLGRRPVPMIKGPDIDRIDGMRGRFN